MKINTKKIILCIIACILISCTITLEASALLGSSKQLPKPCNDIYNGILGTYDDYPVKGNFTVYTYINETTYIVGRIVKDNITMPVNLRCSAVPYSRPPSPCLFTGTIGIYQCTGDVYFHGDNEWFMYGTMCFGGNTFWYSAEKADNVVVNELTH